jgi:ABC-type lipoprotein release transport system permease subunit
VYPRWRAPWLASPYAAAATVALAAVVVASWIPMRRAAMVDPTQSLRQM